MPFEFTQPLNSSSLSERTYELIREQILSGTVAQGERLDVRELAKGLDVSRTPVKEAINRLAHEGLVTIRNRARTTVSTVEPEDLIKLFEVRLMIELWAAEKSLTVPGSLDLARLEETVRASARLFESEGDFDYRTFIRHDADLHNAIVESAGNSHLIKIYQSLHAHIQIMRFYWGQARTQAFRSQQEHQRILKAFHNRNLKAIKSALTTHLVVTRDDMTSRLRQRTVAAPQETAAPR